MAKELELEGLAELEAARPELAGAGMADIAEAVDLMSDDDLAALPKAARKLADKLRAECQRARDRAAGIEWDDRQEADLEASASVEAAYPI